jgi:Mannosyltransferase (PIG-V)
LVSLVAVVGVRATQPPSVAQQDVSVPATPGWHNAIDGTNRWDAGWLERIARDGYDWNDQSAAFFPGYPLAIRALAATIPLDEVTAGLLVSNAAFLTALVVLYALTTREFSTSTARRTVVLVAAFPTSFFFLAPYSESLFLLASLLTFWWARRGRWGGAAAAGFAAAATRSFGVILMPALLWEAWNTRGEHSKSAFAAALAPLLAPVLYALYWLIHAGDALLPIHAQASWFRAPTIPFVTLGDALWLGIIGIQYPRGLYWTADVLLTAALLLPFALRWRTVPRSYAIYVGVSLLIILSLPPPYRPLVSAPRYIMVLFPIFWTMANTLTGRWFYVTLGTFVIGFLWLSVLFMNWGLIP